MNSDKNKEKRDNPQIKIIIRKYLKDDSNKLVNILRMNEQYMYPEIEGPEAMLRVSECEAAIFLVAECNHHPLGFVKAIYDGSRALIHLLSIHPKFQNKGIGTKLINEVISKVKNRGATTISVTVSESSVGFWKTNFFKKIPISLMLRDSI